MSRHVEYAELQVTTNFSFLRGASHPEEYVAAARALKYAGIGIADHMTLSGIVRADEAAKECGLRFLVGCRLDLTVQRSTLEALGVPQEFLPSAECSFVLLAYPTTVEAYGRLCRFLTYARRERRAVDLDVEGHRAHANQHEVVYASFEKFLEVHKGMALLIVPPSFRGHSPAAARGSIEVFRSLCGCVRESLSAPHGLFVAVSQQYCLADRGQKELLQACAKEVKLPLIATNDVYYHLASRKPLHDVITCIRHQCTVAEAGYRLFQNAERYLKRPEEMARLFREVPEAIRATLQVAEMAAQFSLDQLCYEYPNEVLQGEKDEAALLRRLTLEGSKDRYPAGVPEKVSRLIADELQLIHELQYEKYFLTCYDIVKFARGRGILCQGRGAAANSAVCFCLGITAVDPSQIDLLFARFVSKERNEPPDIDIDFEHERREEVIQYIYEKYTTDRAALVCEVVTYRQRSAVRDVGKALGLPLEVVEMLAGNVHRWTGAALDSSLAREAGVDAEDPTVQNTLRLSCEILGFPRHLSQHVGGFIISEKPLCELVPIRPATMEGRSIIEWDKDDIEALSMLKIDILALGMLTCIRKALDFVNNGRTAAGLAPYEIHSIPSEDPAVYDMICNADTVGVFQVESRAQMSMLPRLKPRCFYDLVIEVAIVRPGPVQGDMVHPYLRRRVGKEVPDFPDERVRGVLGKTLGVPLFQEQAMRVVITLADFSPEEAERLRRAMAAWRRNKAAIARFTERIITGMCEKGYERSFAERCVRQIQGFSEYGFPESHAASFALLVYVSAWLKRHYPVEFAAALLNSQPMGFYSSAQIISDLQRDRTGVWDQPGGEVLPVDVNWSEWDCTVEGRALRLGQRMVKGLHMEDTLALCQARNRGGAFRTIPDLWHRLLQCGPRSPRKFLIQLARADAFCSLSLGSREALWDLYALPKKAYSLEIREPEGQIALPLRSRKEVVLQDIEHTGLSLRGHPLEFVRGVLTARRATTAGELANARERIGERVWVAGIAAVKQRPCTAKGVLFLTLEDETGSVNVVVKPKQFEQYQRILLMSRVMLVAGMLERVEAVTYLTGFHFECLERLCGESIDEIQTRSFSY